VRALATRMRVDLRTRIDVTGMRSAGCVPAAR